MVDIPLGLFRIDGIQLLGGRQGVEGADGQHLGLTAGKEAGAMDPGQDPYLSGQGTDLIHAAAVHPFASQEPLFDHFFLHFVQADFNVDVKVLVLFCKFLGKIPAGGSQPLFPDVLVIGV